MTQRSMPRDTRRRHLHAKFQKTYSVYALARWTKRGKQTPMWLNQAS